MTQTRLQSGKTPRYTSRSQCAELSLSPHRKTQHPGYVETPGRRGRPRKSGTPDQSIEDVDTQDSSRSQDESGTRKANGRGVLRKRNTKDTETLQNHSTYVNGSAEKPTTDPTRLIDGWEPGKDPKVDYSGHFEFGGSIGVSALMVGFPLLMYYMWIGATYYDGKAPMPVKGQTFAAFLRHLGQLVYTGAFPSIKAWAMYWIFFMFETICYIYLPGVWTKGKPLRHDGGKQLDYYCSAVWSWWVTLGVAAFLHITGIFKLYTIIDEFGPLMSVAIISGFALSILTYVSAIYRGAEHRITGYPIYDFFMGAELNPRLFGILDLKMFYEVRIPWYMLFLISAATAARQYENNGYVSGEVAFLCIAHFLYGNACAKGEECIVATWDMYYEKLGFMLTFWNLAGVPLSYCHCTIYLANHHPDTYRWNRYALGALVLAYLFVYWVWDTTNSQKNRFRAQETGHDVQRKAFPQLPWQVVENPKTITSEDGFVILADGWCK